MRVGAHNDQSKIESSSENVTGWGGVTLVGVMVLASPSVSAPVAPVGESIQQTDESGNEFAVTTDQRLADGGESKITVVRAEESGEVLFKAATAPGTEVVVDDLSEVEGSVDGQETQFRLSAAGDPDDPGVGVGVNQTIQGPVDAQRQADELSDDDMSYRQDAIGIPTSERRVASGGVSAADCAKVTAGGEAYWRGCFERRYIRGDDDPDHWYMLDMSWAHGHHEGWVGGLDWAYVANRYYKSERAVQITRQRPVTDIEKGSCTDVTLHLEPYGVGVSETFRACPEKIKLGGDEDSVYATWDGWASRDDSWRAASVITFAQMKSGSNSVLTMTLKVDEDENRYS